MDAPKHKYHMLSDINEQPFPLNLLAEIGLSNQFSDAKQCTADIRKGLAAALSTLEEREELAILLRYRHGYKLDEIAEQLDVTRERARQVIRNALDKLNQPFARSLIECGIMGYIKDQAGAKADEIVRERLSKEYLRGYETGKHDAVIQKEVTLPFDFSHIDISELDVSYELSDVGIENFDNLMNPAAPTCIMEALREQVRHCYLSREGYMELIDYLNEQGFNLCPDENIRPDASFLPEFFSCPTIEYDEDNDPIFDKEHRLALNYASWMLPQYIARMPLKVMCHDNDTQYIIESGTCVLSKQQSIIDEYTFNEQKTVSSNEIFPYNLLPRIFGKDKNSMWVFPETESYFVSLVENALTSLDEIEEKILRLVFQYNLKAEDLPLSMNIPANTVTYWWMMEGFPHVVKKAIYKLRRSGYLKAFRAFYSESPQKIFEHIRQNSEVESVFSLPIQVWHITKCTDFCDMLLKQNPTFSLNQLRDAYLNGETVTYNGEDFQQRIWELFPGNCIPFYLLNDTILNERTWFQCDSLGIYSSALKFTVPEFANLEVARAFFGTRMFKNAYEHSTFDEGEIYCELDRIFLVETTSHEKKLYWWPRSKIEAYGAENFNLVPYKLHNSVIESLYCAVMHNVSKPRSESTHSEADRVLCEHFDRIPNSLVFDTIMRTRIWCPWPSGLFVRSIMGLRPDDSVLKAYLGVGFGNYGETLLSATAHSSIENALFVETTSRLQMLFWVFSDGSVYKFDISSEFLNKLLRAIEGGCHLSETEQAALQTKLNKLEYAFCNFYLNKQLQDNEVSSLKELRHNLIFSMSIEHLDFTVRTYNCLKRSGIDTVEKLCKNSEEDLMRVRNMGKKPLDEIKKKLQEYGLTLKKPRTLAELQEALAELGRQLQDDPSDT